MREGRPLAELVVGTWTLVSSTDIEPDGTRSETWGARPLGMYMFDAAGNFTQIVMRSDLRRVGSREQMSAEQARAVASGSLAMFGTYTVDEAARVLHVRFVGSTFASLTGSAGQRHVTMLSPDEMKFTNAGRVGGRQGESVWRRVT